jgi:hypothetical protein
LAFKLDGFCALEDQTAKLCIMTQFSHQLKTFASGNEAECRETLGCEHEHTSERSRMHHAQQTVSII